LEDLFNLSEEEKERALRLHRECIVFDSLGGLPTVFSDRMLRRLDELVEGRRPAWEVINELDELGFEELVKNPEHRRRVWDTIQKAGVTGASITVGAFSGPAPFTFEGAIRDLARWIHLFDVLDGMFVKVLGAEDIRRAKREGKFAVLLNLQNTTHINGDLDNLDLFYRLGIRQIQLTYNSRNLVGDGCTERTDAGLSNFGLEVIDRMNRLGVLIDLSHCGHQTTMDAVEASRDPVILSHANCYALCRHDRCKRDEEIQAVAEKGGYIGITVVPSFVSEKEAPTLQDFLDHIDHVVELVGVDHVGIGSDDTGAADIPRKLLDLYDAILPMMGFRPEHRMRSGASTRGFEHYVDWPNFTRGLVARGYSDQEIRKILGENFIRVLERVVG